MDEKFDIQKYLAEGVEQVVKDALRAMLKDPKESMFLAKFAVASKKASAKREEEEKAEPCPFSPYSDISVKDTSLKEALRSNLFTALRDGDILAGEHIGGCVLYEKRDQVEAILAQK